MTVRFASFANLTLTAGDYSLVDYLMPVVLPALTDDTLVRQYANTRYYFRDVVVDVLEISNLVRPMVWGRFIKDTTLRREQYYDEREGLVKDVQELETSPSAFFALLLDNHKLIFLPETSHPPTIDNFQTTLKRFVLQKYKREIDRRYHILIERGEKQTKKSLRKNFPIPIINVVPLATRASIDDFLDKFAELREIRFRIIKPNSEISASDVFESVREVIGPLEPSVTDLVTRNTEGLQNKESREVIVDAGRDGLTGINVKGRDADGNSISGNNERFRYKAPVEDGPDRDDRRAQKLGDLFHRLTEDDVLQAEKPDETTRHRVISSIRDES